MLPCAAALGDEPAARPQDAGEVRNSASWSATQWNVAVERIASTDASAIGSGAPRSATT